jgi:hypothetical protein
MSRPIGLYELMQSMDLVSGGASSSLFLEQGIIDHWDFLCLGFIKLMFEHCRVVSFLVFMLAFILMDEGILLCVP